MSRNGKNNKGGRPKGKRNASTIEREAVIRAFQQKVFQSADVLFQSQLLLSRGQTYLYKIEKEVLGTGKNKKIVKKRPVLVTDQWEIEDYLNSLVEEGELNDPEDTYYYIVTKEPENNAIDSLLDRGIGKAKQTFEFEGEIGLANKFDEKQLSRIARRLLNGDSTSKE